MATKKLTIASGKASGTHSNMPLLLVPSEVTNIGALTLAEAQSARFYTDASLTVEIAREVVSADELHFKGTSVSSASEFWVDYDGVRADYAVTDTYGRNAVWTGNTVVYHMDDATTTTVTDSTGNGYTGTKRSSTLPVEATGKIGKAQDGTYTLENDGSFIYNTSINPLAYISMGSNSGDTGVLAVFVSSAWQKSTYTFSAGTWYKVRCNFTGTRLITYVNGTQWNDFAKTTTARSFSFWFNADAISDDRAFMGYDGLRLNIMSRSSSITGLWPLDGKMDEFRWTASSVSADWETTEYNNQSDNAAFWVAEDVGGGGGAWNAYPMIHLMQMSAGL